VRVANSRLESVPGGGGSRNDSRRSPADFEAEKGEAEAGGSLTSRHPHIVPLLRLLAREAPPRAARYLVFPAHRGAAATTATRPPRWRRGRGRRSIFEAARLSVFVTDMRRRRLVARTGRPVRYTADRQAHEGKRGCSTERRHPLSRGLRQAICWRPAPTRRGRVRALPAQRRPIRRREGNCCRRGLFFRFYAPPEQFPARRAFAAR